MGVKSLWQLLDPVGRPVLLETMEGKAMAIDSSIWIYQFQATMRDTEGRGLVNAHVLGFLRRICKLLFYGIKPVFVFDGGAPTLKRATIAERKNKKSGAAASHAKLAEKLLAAHMRREALKNAQPPSKDKSKFPTGPVNLDETTVFLEDIDASVPKTPAKKKQTDTTESPPSSKKKRWHDHDPYRLPDVNLEEAVAKVTRTAVPDPRLATEDELRAFIDEMRPEDFDVGSEEFRELPTEVQYEIIGDLRLKSRQTSYKRLQNMLKHSKTPLDFSKEQIKNLKQRNALTQQLLVTTDTIGQAHVSIPIRIASERNREYVLVKNEGGDGGWVLGIRDEGTAAKPIKIDHESEHELVDDSDEDMEEVKIDEHVHFDPDLREHRRNQALSALANRYSPKKLAPLSSKVARRKRSSKPLFDLDEDDEVLATLPQLEDEDEDDPEVAVAIQESLELMEESNLRQALEASRNQMPSTPKAGSSSKLPRTSSSGEKSGGSAQQHQATSHLDDVYGTLDSDEEDLYASPTRLETALSIANAGPSRKPFSHSDLQPRSVFPVSAAFGNPTNLLTSEPSTSVTSRKVSSEPSEKIVDSGDDMEEVAVLPGHSQPGQRPSGEMSTLGGSSKQFSTPNRVSIDLPPSDSPVIELESDEEMEEVLPSLPNVTQTVSMDSTMDAIRSSPHGQDPEPRRLASPSPITVAAASPRETETHVVPIPDSPIIEERREPLHNGSAEIGSSDIEFSGTQSRSQSPSHMRHTELEHEHEGEDWDAAHEMDPQAEQGEFARFISQVKGRDIDDVRQEIEEEIRVLNQQKKVAMRDSEDITQQMISQIMIMLRLFGIPYITAPMEAEAQCAELLTLGLVDGIITDDSDVFLFGGARVLKNMFNQSKTVECFLLSDLERELGLDRDKLIRLAYLLGSDYTEGLPGVGPVVAMELLTEFPGEGGLHMFKEWWRKVQSGRDAPQESQSSFRRRFKKRFKELYLPDDWPNPAVRDAYYHPTVDHSDEPFKWGLPDLDALRGFFNSELGWQQSKVDDLLLPIIHKMGKRGQNAALNKQGNLNSFFDITGGSGTVVPRKRQAYASKRLQQVVSEFRRNRNKEKEQQQQDDADAFAPEEANGHESSGDEARPKKKARKTPNNGKVKGKERAVDAAGTSARGSARGGRGGRGRGRGRGAAKKTARKRKADSTGEEGEPEDAFEPGSVSPPPMTKELRPRPKPKPAYQTADDNGEGGEVEMS